MISVQVPRKKSWQLVRRQDCHVDWSCWHAGKEKPCARKVSRAVLEIPWRQVVWFTHRHACKSSSTELVLSAAQSANETTGENTCIMVAPLEHPDVAGAHPAPGSDGARGAAVTWLDPLVTDFRVRAVAFPKTCVM
jgi:hypothetical protein